ncbi:MAG: CoA activase [Bacteroidetes bacterium]|nr:CoA activase [Bacteroidota bacterium]
MAYPDICLGIDIGSITVKLVAYDTTARTLLWSGYRRHHARQHETVLILLTEVRAALQLPADVPVAVTGSGAQQASEQSGIPYVQEVNALMRAVRILHPDARSIIELGGEDAKMVSIDPLENGEVALLPVMNEKCAAGTGSMIDRMTARMDLTPAQAAAIGYRPGSRHPIAAKCGVFAETDIVGLLKNGVAREELLCALFEAIVQQNLSTLSRGRTPLPRTLLLGGPHEFYPGLAQCWRHRLEELWNARGIEPMGDMESSVVVPEHALFLPAIGAILEQAVTNDAPCAMQDAAERLRLATGNRNAKLPSRIAFDSEEERTTFTGKYSPPDFIPPDLSGRGRVRVHLGLDCGSTSIKAVLLSEDFEVLRKDFAFATHDPIDDARRMIRRLCESVRADGAEPEIVSLGTTGYAKDILAAVLRADIAVVETISHKESACLYHPRADVICDVGGQDIKVLLLQHGNVVDFRLNTQCSAGTGYFLQTVADRFDTSIYRFADEALSAAHAPEFSAGCTIFLQSDIVNFMRAGYAPAEIMAGVTQVLPVNIWVYSARLYDLPSAGQVFVLQGGTQRNLAAVRAQVQYIEAAFEGSGRMPDIRIHPHPAEAGAIGCALIAARKRKENNSASWIGPELLEQIEYETEQSDNTRCRGCGNRCARTMLHTRFRSGSAEGSSSDAPRETIIIARCERGRTDDANEQRRIRILERERDSLAPNYPHLQQEAFFSPSWIASQMRSVFGREVLPVSGTKGTAGMMDAHSAREGEGPRICIPRVMNFHAYAPLFISWFLAMGIREEDILISPATTRAMSSTGTARATIDPCFPAKICFAHVDALLRMVRSSDRPSWLFFPAILRLPGLITDAVDSMTCTVAAVLPEVVNAAYTLEIDEFARHGSRFLHPFLSLETLENFSSTMATCFAPLLGASRKNFRRAAELAWTTQEHCMHAMQAGALETLSMLERERRMGVVLLGRSYHADRGLNHGVLEAFQEMGFPLFTAETLPRDAALLVRLFGEEDAGAVRDVWPNPFSENSGRKMWAAKYAARHPNLLAVELSNFKCGHDAPTYSLVREIFRAAGKPYFSFLDLDENTPQNTLNIRIETIRHFMEAWCRERGFVSPLTIPTEEACLQIAE